MLEYTISFYKLKPVNTGIFMEFSVKSAHPEKQRSACLVIGVFENRRLSNTAERLDSISEGYISSILRKGDLEGKLGQTLLLHNPPNILADRLLLVGCGRERELGDNQYREIIRKLATTLTQTGATDAVCCLTEINIKGRDIHWKVRQAVEVMLDTLYTFEEFKSKKELNRRPLRRILFSVPTRRDLNTGERAIAAGQAIAKGVSLAKNLGNLPPNICTPSYLANEAENLSKKFNSINVAILDEKDIAALKMGALLAVAQGSKNPPRLITLEYQGRKDTQKPVVLVGKGITFDTGGNSLKMPVNMVGMKFDMCGAATVLAVLQAAAELELPINLVGVVSSAENMPGSNATRPEDIITTMSGLTVEILNTDAEGRLVLCDALTYCERFNPDVVIDIATLTNACIAALGKHASGLMSNHNPLANDLLTAGLISGDRCWQLPLWEEYFDVLNSNFADMANVAHPPTDAGAIIAGGFLSRFTKKYHWAHLDVAGSSFRSAGKDRGATGRPVPLLVQYLLDRCQTA